MCVCTHMFSVMSDSLWPHGLCPIRVLCLWDLPGKNAGVGCHFLLQGIFLTQGSNLYLRNLLHWQADILPLSHLGSQLADSPSSVFSWWQECTRVPIVLYLLLCQRLMSSLSCWKAGPVRCCVHCGWPRRSLDGGRDGGSVPWRRHEEV